MSKDRKTTINDRPGRLSKPFKDSMVELFAREAISVHPNLTRIQLQRVFSYSYHALRNPKTGEGIIQTARQAAKDKFPERKIQNDNERKK